MIRRALLTVLTLSGAATLNAQAVPPAEESINPDRPDVTNGTHIVNAGLVQIEVGGMYTRDEPAQGAVSSPFTARIGLLDWLEARIGTDGVLTQTDAGVRATGFGNVQLGAKLRLWSDPGGVPVLSVLPNVNLPTADAKKGLGSGDADYTLALLTGTDVGARGHIDFNYGVGLIGAGDGQRHFTQHLLSTSGSYALTTRWSPYAELFWFSRQEAGGTSALAFDGGAIYTVTPRFAIDGGVQAGMTRPASDFAVFGGISIVVGSAGGDGVHARKKAEPQKAKRPPKTRR